MPIINNIISQVVSSAVNIGMDALGNVLDTNITNPSIKVTEKDFDAVLNANGYYKRKDVDIYNKIYRFGMLDPANSLTNTREYIFFTKPDLHILGDENGNGTNLNPELANNPFFKELYRNYPEIIYQLQSSADPSHNPLCLLLTNTVYSNLEVPSLTATTVDTPVNAYGTGYEYRGTSEASDDNFSFSLEFKDTKNLEVYQFFRAFEEYERLKSRGLVSPFQKYTTNRIIHDQIGIYKFLVDEDMMTIVYYAYFCGVMFLSLPRDAFNNPDFSDGANFTIDMKAAFVEDMNPLIISDFNYLTRNYRSGNSNMDLSIWNNEYGMMEGTPAVCPYISKRTDSNKKDRYALLWRGKE